MNPAWLLILSLGLQTLALSAEPLKNLRASGKADVNGGRLYYEVYGHGAPLVFLHPGLADSRVWDRQVNYFSDKYTVVRFDARGYGQSDAPTAPYAPAEDLYALLQFLKIDRACIVGLSIGGTQAIDMALAHPQAVSALVVIAGSPGWLQYSDEMSRRLAAIASGAKEKGPASVVEGWLSASMLAVVRTQPSVERQMRMFLTQNVAGSSARPSCARLRSRVRICPILRCLRWSWLGIMTILKLSSART